MLSEREVINDAIRSLILEREKSIPKVPDSITKDHSTKAAIIGGTIVGLACFFLFGTVGIAGALLHVGFALNAAIPMALAGGALGALTGKVIGQKVKERTSEEMKDKLEATTKAAGLSARTYESLGLATPSKFWLFDSATQSEHPVRDRSSIGRNPTCSIVLDHPAVSKMHAIFHIESGVIYILDLGSTNGTLVNGIRVEERTPCPIGCEISVGGCLLTLGIR